MPTVSPPSDVFAFRPPTSAEVDQLATISATSFILGGLALVGVLGAALAVALKTRLPGRWSIFVSIVLLAAWWVFVQTRGGDLDAAFGPMALLVACTVYSVCALIFAFGYLRMGFAVHRLCTAPGASHKA